MHNRGLGGWMVKRRMKSPDKTALIFDDTSISYRSLADDADRMAAVLFERGVQKGDRVAFLGDNCPEFLVTLFGAATLGAVFVPVNTRLAPPEITHVLEDSGARVLVHDPAATATVASLDLEVDHVLETGADGLEAILAETRAGHVDVAVSLEDPAVIMYTSGTTGRAKGAVLTHGNLTWMAINCVIDYDIVSTDVALMISPLFHAASLGMGALPCVLKGATLVLEKGFDPERALRLIPGYGVTMLSGVPTTYQLLADHELWPGTDLSSLRKLTCGGSPVPTRIMNAYEERGLSFSQGYGMTESSPGATSLAPAMSRAKQGSVGLGHFFTDVRVVDVNGAVAARGTVGEIEIMGPNVFAGYHNLPEATAAAFSDDGWLRSGDMGYLDADGYLFISDRLKDMIISGGENIYPAEPENLINDIEGVTGVAVIGVPDDRWGEVPWAVLTVRDGAAVTLEDVRSHLSGRIAKYKIPKNVIVVEALPRTASGKIRKAELRLRYARSRA
ncbi:acyl-CoA synthetase [Microbacterium foliorum]|uniref:acyl-CoA synthetase n=1 Tax=Microbacterium foliorum TaxID=104336 RepID=UPI001D8AF7C6|nr:long-chain fatty acid--CoA ligase [Microbacterium foliorum]CAH0178270.1 Long-chain-fatty-acid--CoA ligase FadD13 [Microbacterium foliorum]CAH0205358.1 Long-chain-fatty-acid--CoA ligase FadD13 [Microbacterium foliorum]